MKLKKGLVHIYTGEGKGKTTAALGLALRALGCGLRVGVFQFFKDKAFACGEAAAVKRLGKNFGFKRFDVPHPAFKKVDEGRLRARLKKAVAEAGKAVKSAKFDVVILDEVLIGVSQGLISEKQVIGLIRSKPETLELVLTGRGAPTALMECADYVTYMRDEKHPFECGTRARRGIEF
jgi:cob(I)alamin adenosyltransferase